MTTPNPTNSAPDTAEMKAVGAFLAAMHDNHLDGGKMREAMIWALGASPSTAAQPAALAGDLAEPRYDSDRIYDRPVGYLPAYELSRLHSGHGAQLRSAKFGPSALDGDVPVYLESSALALVQALIGAQRAINSMKVEAETAAQGDEQMMLDACEQISNEGLEASLAIQAALSTAAQPLTQDEKENQLCMSSASCGQASTNESAFITSTQRSAGTFSASSERQSYRDSDGMPTERAVLEREWRRMKIALSAPAAQPPADGALNTIAAMFHSAEEIEVLLTKQFDEVQIDQFAIDWLVRQTAEFGEPGRIAERLLGIVSDLLDIDAG